MKKSLLVIVALVGLNLVDVGVAQAWPGWRRSRTTYVPSTSVTVTQGQLGTGYRSFSYEPSTPTMIQPSYRQTTRIPPHMNAGGHTAGYKATGF